MTEPLRQMTVLIDRDGTRHEVEDPSEGGALSFVRFRLGVRVTYDRVPRKDERGQIVTNEFREYAEAT